MPYKIKIKQLKSLMALVIAAGYFFVAITQGFVTASATAEAIEAADAQAVNNPEGTFPYIKTFLISGYYTPLPDQTKYATGSYETDVRLNGEGVWAADGTTVYPGLIAAPPNFAFETKMKIPGIGVGAVHDRGGAIKNNRLDVWMGSGEEGLARALAWGLRSVDVTVYGIDENIKESMDISALPQADLNKITERLAVGSYSAPQTIYFNKDASFGDENEQVRNLQIFLKKAGYFNDIETGYYDGATQTAVEAFQLDEKIINDVDDTGAGNFGPRSRVALERLLGRKKNAELGRLPNGPIKFDETGESVTHLQNVLKKYGFLNEVSGVFDQATFNALKRFQLDYGIIDNVNAYGAGYYGPKTQEAIKQLIADYYTPAIGTPTVARVPHAKYLSLDDRGPEVELLQLELKRLNFFGLEPTGYYGRTTEHAVLKFQQAFNIVESTEDAGAGSAGPQTLAQLNKLTGDRGLQIRLIAQTTENKEIVASRVADERKLFAGTITPESFTANLRYGMRSGEVERLQSTLKRLGFFQGRMTTEYFGDITKQSLASFQRSHSLPETGAFDDSTRAFLNRIVVST